MSTHSGVNFQNVSATPANFHLAGGEYGFVVTATWGGGDVALNMVGPDGSTLVQIVDMKANGYTTADLVAGNYQLTITTATAVYAGISPIPS